MTRILLLGDTAGTGFGTVTRDLAAALVRRGEDLYILSMNEDAGLQTDPGWPQELRQRVVLLGMADGWTGLGAMTKEGQAARDKLVERALGVFTGRTVPGWQPDVALFIGDVASLWQSPWPQWLPAGLPALNCVPIEGVDLPPAWGALWERIRPVGMTRFGAEQISQVVGHEVPWVYHGVDPEAFYPVSGKRPLVLRTRRGSTILRSRAECRAFLGWPRDATILFRADRHMPRKNYAAMFRSVAPVLARHQDALLLFHCRTVDHGGNLAHELSKYPPALSARMLSTGFHDKLGGVDRKLLCAMYNAADLYLSTSAEGFGLTVAEALACGTPAVALDYSSLPEVVGPAGVLVPYALQDNPYSYFWALPRQEAYEAAVERLVSDRSERQRLGLLGPVHVAQFSWDAAAEQFSQLVVGAEAPAPPPVPAARRLAALGLVEARA